VPYYDFILAIKAQTGDRIWQFRPESGFPEPPAILNNTIYVGTWGKFYSIDASAGVENWSIEIGDWGPTAPVATENAVYFGSDSLQAVSPKNGDLIWKTGPDTFSDQVSLAYGKVFVSMKGESALSVDRLFAFDAETGEESWMFKPEYDISYSSAATAVADETVITCSNGSPSGSGGYLHGLDAHTGREKWILEFPKSAPFQTMVTGDAIFLATRERGDEHATYYSLK
jgi:outer membrane protein assembly factor BamB